MECLVTKRLRQMDWYPTLFESAFGQIKVLSWEAGEGSSVKYHRCEERYHKHRNQTVKQRLGDSEDHLGAVMWNSNIVALNYLKPRLTDIARRLTTSSRKQQNRRRLSILELGAGTGCLGISLAVSGMDVILTDVPELLPLLRHNIELNAGAIAAAKGSCEAEGLCWGAPMSLSPMVQRHCGNINMEDVFDIVILCDALYGNAEVWPALLSLLKHVCATPKTEVINFCEQRVQDVEMPFLQLIEADGDLEFERHPLDNIVSSLGMPVFVTHIRRK